MRNGVNLGIPEERTPSEHQQAFRRVRKTQNSIAREALRLAPRGCGCERPSADRRRARVAQPLPDAPALGRAGNTSRAVHGISAAERQRPGCFDCGGEQYSISPQVSGSHRSLPEIMADYGQRYRRGFVAARAQSAGCALFMRNCGSIMVHRGVCACLLVGAGERACTCVREGANGPGRKCTKALKRCEGCKPSAQSEAFERLKGAPVCMLGLRCRVCSLSCLKHLRHGTSPAQMPAAAPTTSSLSCRHLCNRSKRSVRRSRSRQRVWLHSLP